MADLDWTYDESRRLFVVRYSGRLVLGDFMTARDARRSLGVAYGAVRLLVDARNADLSELTSEDFKAMEAHRDSAFGGRAERAAALVGLDTDVGIAELWGFYRNRSAPGSTAVFISEREALAWLFAGAAGDGPPVAG